MAKSIIPYLQKQNATFNCIAQDTVTKLQDAYHIKDSCWIRAVLLEAKDGLAMAVVPADFILDFNLLSHLTSKKMEPLAGSKANAVMKGFVSGTRIPIPEFFNIPGIIEQQIVNMGKVWFEAGDGENVIEMNAKDYISLCQQSFMGTFALSKAFLTTGGNEKISIRQFTPMRIQERIEDIIELPSMPGIALEILKLRDDRHATPKILAQIIERDPSLSAQIVGWASAAYYGYRGPIDSVEVAINNVLGYDMVINMCLAVVMGKTLNVPVDGPLGLRNYWRQAILCATLAERLCCLIPSQFRPLKGLVYLSGLLHNIGHLLLSHAFPPLSFVVSRFIEANPYISVTDIEKHVLGVSHAQIGSWLLTSWHLPEQIIEATRWHHQEEYASTYSAYSNLIFVANQMMGKLLVGDARPAAIPLAVLDVLGLSQNEVSGVWLTISPHLDELEALADRLAA